MKMQKEDIADLLTRGVAALYPSREFLEAKLSRGEQVTIYLGIDPTGPSLHIGNAVILRKLGDFQKAGHKVILLMGDFTAMIGDPTDKSAARKQLTRKQVLQNLKAYKKQAAKLVSFSGKNKAVIKYNSKWLGKMKFADVLNLASEMTVQQMLERDMFEKRMEEGKPIFIHEFMYPLMQGYDSVAMDVDGEIGGNDQTFNMLTGRHLLKTLKNKEKFVLTMKILEDNTGKKMGKTEGNMVALSDSPTEMFGKVMSWSDSLIIPALELCTGVPTEDIARIAADMVSGVLNPRDAKMRLAREIIATYHSEKDAQHAQENFIATFQKKEIPDDVPEVSADGLLVDVFLKTAIVSSKTEFRRLIDEGAIMNLTTDVKITDPAAPSSPGVYRIGKKRFIKIV